MALLLVTLSASALISTMVTTRIQMASNARFSAAFRLAVELSDWVRQGGMKVLASGTVDPFDLVDQMGSVPVVSALHVMLKLLHFFTCTTGDAGFFSRCQMRASWFVKTISRSIQHHANGRVVAGICLSRRA